MPPDICIENPVISGTNQYLIQYQKLYLRLYKVSLSLEAPNYRL